MNRALPGWAIDLIRDGVPGPGLRRGGGKAVWRALVQTASSAQIRGWGIVEWEFLVLAKASHLGRQVALKDGRRERTGCQVDKTLFDAWNQAWEWRTMQPETWDRDTVRKVAHRRAAQMRDLASDGDVKLTDQERAVLVFVAEQAVTRGLTRLALPRVALMEGTGLTERQVRRAVPSLHHKGLLMLHAPGVQGDKVRRRAALYNLADEEALRMYRGTRSMGQSPRPMGQSENPAGATARPMGQQVVAPTEENTVPTISYTRDQIATIVGYDVLARLDAAEAEEVRAEVRHLHTVVRTKDGDA